MLDRFQSDGFLHLPGFYRGNMAFFDYLSELRWCARQLLGNDSGLTQFSLQELVERLYERDPAAPLPLYRLATMPPQLASWATWKFSLDNLRVARELLGRKAVLGSPPAGDSLIGYPPDRDEFLLPWHEDWPYILQSSRQVTFWVALTHNRGGETGALELMKGSHAHGPFAFRRDRHEHYAAIVPGRVKKACEVVRLTDWDIGDVVVMDTHLLHRGTPNRSTRTRLIHTLRFTDLNEPTAIRLGWPSKTYPRAGAEPEDLLVEYREAV